MMLNKIRYFLVKIRTVRAYMTIGKSKVSAFASHEHVSFSRWITSGYMVSPFFFVGVLE
jgi:hypothetical protein